MGIRLDDVVVQVTSRDAGSALLWHVVRDGNVIAVIDSETLDGVACVGSGVGAA